MRIIKGKNFSRQEKLAKNSQKMILKNFGFCPSLFDCESQIAFVFLDIYNRI